jgi:N-acetylneuraminic acid mutarotase
MKHRVFALTCMSTVSTIAAVTNLPAAEWKRLAPLPEPCGGFVCGTIAGKLIVAGGTNWKDDTKRWLDTVWTYDPSQNTWQAAARLSSPLGYAVYSQDSRDLWCWGGSNGLQTQQTLFKFDEKLSTKAVATLERGLVYAGGTVSNSTLYVVGGSDDQAHFENITNTFQAIDLRTGKATRLADYPETAVGVAAVAACGERIYVFGGARWDAETQKVVNLSAAHAYNIATNRWEPLPPVPTANRGLAAVKFDDRYILIAGGFTTDEAGFTDEAFLFDTQRGECIRTKRLPYRALVGLVTLGDYVYCLGGEDIQKHRTDAVFRIPWKELLPQAR